MDDDDLTSGILITAVIEAGKRTRKKVRDTEESQRKRK